jgi:hypothetical protein
MQADHDTLIAQIRGQLDHSLEVLRRSRALPGLRYAEPAEAPKASRQAA